MSRRLYKYLTFTNDKDLDKRFHEEMTAQLCLKVKGRFVGELSRKQLDTLYDKSDDLSSEVKKEVVFILGEVDKMAASVGALKVKLTKYTLLNLFDFVQIFAMQNGQIVNYKAFLQCFLDLDADLIATSLGVTEEDQVDKSYTYWCFRNAVGSYYRKIRYSFAEWFR
jgi:hypothetical protein